MDMMLNGKPADISDFEADELAAAVLISLFSWRKSNPDDGGEGAESSGMVGRHFRGGGRVIESARASGCCSGRRFSTTLRRAEAYAKESLQWLIDDAVVARIEVSAERSGTDQIALRVTCYRPDDTQALQARFQNVWE